jgi:hypothetical protein
MLPVVGKHSKDEWLRDIDARQRNVVFPDTAQNEGRFWRNILSGKRSLSLAQWIGILLMWAALIVCLLTLWPHGEGPWWQKLINGYAIFGGLTVALVAFIILGNRRAQRTTRKR